VRRTAPLLLIVLAACQAPDPQTAVEVVDLETYWAVDSPSGATQLIAPVVRFRLRNKGPHGLDSIQATATFRREGENEAWSGAYLQVKPQNGRELSAGQAVAVMLKPEGEGRYTSTVDPAQMLAHAQFKDVRVEVFIRLGASAWVKMAETPIERRLGSHAVAATP
jgi:hypothetical protein